MSFEMHLVLRDFRAPRNWRRPWFDPPGFFLPNCPCCSSAPAQSYHVFGGSRFGSPTVRLSTNYKWDGGAWASTAALPTARDNIAAATPASPGPAFIYGGISNLAFLTECDAYTPDAWSVQTSLPANPRYQGMGCSILGKAYSFGGSNSSFVPQIWNDEFSPSANSWVSKGSLPAARANGAASYIGGKGYCICGDDTHPTQTRTHFEFDPIGNTWTTRANFPTLEDALTAWTLNGKIYANFGFPGGRTQSTYIVDTWSAGTNPTAAAATSSACGTSFDNASQVGFITGGNLSLSSSSTQHLDFVPSIWTTRAAVPSPLQNAGAALA